LVWIKATNPSFNFNQNLSDTNRGTGKFLSSNTTAAAGTDTNDITAFNTTGFAIGSNQRVNDAAYKYVSWTFRKQPKFFDVVTYTGTGSATTIPHSLGSVPGCIIVKKTSAVGQWCVYHRGLTSASYAAFLNLTDAETNDSAVWNATNPTSTVFSVGTSAGTNSSGATYVAYIFAHDAGGFGLTGTDNVVSCGSFTNDAAGAGTVNLGYEPQWVIFKNATSADGWYMYDNMRGFSMASSARTTADGTYGDSIDSPPLFSPSITTSSTGFSLYAGLTAGSSNIIYIAIRRGPMKVPTDATTVFKPLTYSGTGATASIMGVGFPPSVVLSASRTGSTDPVFIDKLRGVGLIIRTPQTFSESNIPTTLTSFDQNGVTYGAQGFVNGSTVPYVNYMLQRAPSFFDEVCYTGTGSATTFTHNLGVAPELWIVKKRSAAGSWAVGSTAIASSEWLILQVTDAAASNTAAWNSTYPSSTVLTVGNSGNTNGSGATYVAYLFATCAGVSKVGSYTGTAAAQTINCGFTAGVKFVLIKRTDSTGDWFYWDSARGIVAGDDPYLLLNTAAAEITTTDYIDTVAAGFEITSTAPAPINANGGTYIFLAIA
jgi:hypothetical protein